MMPLSVEQASKILGVTTYIVREEIRRGKLAAYFVGRKMRIDEDEIQAYKARNRVEARPTVEKVTHPKFVYHPGDKVVGD